jgi:hypothetical protein
MELTKYIRVIEWPETIREQIIFSDDTKVRLDPEDHAFKLKPDAFGKFPLDTDLWIKIPVINPLAHRQWLAIEPIFDAPTGTDIKGRLHDGTDEYYWDGGDWVIAGATDWNNAPELNDNIPTFRGQAGSEHKLGFVFNPTTVDDNVTPSLFMIKVLMDVWMDQQESWMVKSFTQALKSITAAADADYDTVAVTTTIDLDDLNLGSLNVVDVARVTDLTDDPEGFDDLLSSYNPTTKVITLSTPVAAGHTLRLVLVYRPIVAITTQQDYTELAELPALLVENLRIVERKRSYEGTSMVPFGADDGWKMDGPDNMTFGGKLVVITDLLVDQQRLAMKVNQFFETNPQIHWLDLDEQLDLVLVTPYLSDYTANNLNDVWSGSMEFEVRNVPYYNTPAVEEPIVKQANISLNK